MSSASQIRIAGVGRYLPQRVVTTDELSEIMNIDPEWIVNRSGVRSRHFVTVELGETHSWMAAQAAREALDDADLDPGDLDLIIYASPGGDQLIPDTSVFVQRELGLSDSGIRCMSTHTTCLSFLTAVDIARAFMDCGRHQNVLIVTAEAASRALDFTRRESGSLFGDASTAVVLQPSRPGQASVVEKIYFETYSEGANYTELPGMGSNHYPTDSDWDAKFSMFQMDGPKVLGLVQRMAPAFFERLHPGLTRGLGDIDLVIPHQASKAGVMALQAFGFPSDKIVTTLETLGNTVSSSIPVTLYEAIRSGRLQRGDRGLMVGSGAGLSFGGAIFVY